MLVRKMKSIGYKKETNRLICLEVTKEFQTSRNMILKITVKKCKEKRWKEEWMMKLIKG